MSMFLKYLIEAERNMIVTYIFDDSVEHLPQPRSFIKNTTKSTISSHLAAQKTICISWVELNKIHYY